MPIYTKNGDAGVTDLYGGKRVRKSVDAIEVLGQFDELNAFLGSARLLVKKVDANKLSIIQNDLFLLGSVVAGVRLKRADIVFLTSRLQSMEKEIDTLAKKMTKLVNFILPNGCESSARLHLARAICRRCERALVTLGEYPNLMPYLNRLSDYLFMLARYENHRRGVRDELVVSFGQQ